MTNKEILEQIANSREEGTDHIKNWMRNRNTVEFLGLWESMNNPDFKGVEFDQFRKDAGLNWIVSVGRK